MIICAVLSALRCSVYSYRYNYSCPSAVLSPLWPCSPFIVHACCFAPRSTVWRCGLAAEKHQAVEFFHTSSCVANSAMPNDLTGWRTLGQEGSSRGSSGRATCHPNSGLVIWYESINKLCMLSGTWLLPEGVDVRERAASLRGSLEAKLVHPPVQATRRVRI